MNGRTGVKRSLGRREVTGAYTISEAELWPIRFALSVSGLMRGSARGMVDTWWYRAWEEEDARSQVTSHHDTEDGLPKLYPLDQRGPDDHVMYDAIRQSPEWLPHPSSSAQSVPHPISSVVVSRLERTTNSRNRDQHASYRTRFTSPRHRRKRIHRYVPAHHADLAPS